MTTDTQPHVQPLPPSQWDDEILDALGAFPGSLNFVLSRWNDGSDDWRGMHTLGLFAHYPQLAKAYMTFNQHVAAASSLPVRVRELLILRTSWLRKLDYEYVQHLILARRAGLDDADFHRLQTGSEAPGWCAEDALVISVAEELARDAAVSAPTMTKLKERFTLQQIMDMIFLVGCYDLLGVAIKSFAIPVEPCLAALHAEVTPPMFAD